MSGHIVALCEKRLDRWRYKLMLRLDGQEALRPYHRFWRSGLSYEQCVAELMRKKLSGEVQEIVGLE